MTETRVVTGISNRILTEREVRSQRDQNIVTAWEAGVPYASIGRAFGMSGQNVKDRIERFNRNKQSHESIDPFAHLTSRTLRLLHSEGLTMVQQVVDAHRKNKLLRIVSFGTKSLREIEKWFPVK